MSAALALIAADPAVEHLQMHNDEGETALDWAITRKKESCVVLLHAAGAVPTDFKERCGPTNTYSIRGKVLLLFIHLLTLLKDNFLNPRSYDSLF